MTDSMEHAVDPEPVHPTGLLEAAVNNLALGLMIFDGNDDVVFCNKRYLEIYGLGPEQVRPGTPIREAHPASVEFGIQGSVEARRAHPEADRKRRRPTHGRPGINRRPDHCIHDLSDAGRRRDGHA